VLFLTVNIVIYLDIFWYCITEDNAEFTGNVELHCIATKTASTITVKLKMVPVADF